MSASLNSEAGPGAGVQSTPAHPAPVSRQGSGSGKKGKSSRTRKQTETYSLTTHQQTLTPKPRKAKARKAKGVKTSGSEGTKSGLVPGAGKGRGVLRVVPTTRPKPESVQLPDSSESLDTDKESEEGTRPPSRPLQESKSDQFALSPVIPPQGTSTPGDVTIVVTDTSGLVRDLSSVLDDAQPSSSAPAKQEGTTAGPVTVSIEVHEVLDSDRDRESVSGSQLTALARMTLGTQTGGDLPCQKDPSQPPSREVREDPRRHLTLDPARPLAELVGRVRTHLSPTRGFASGGFGVPPLSGDDLVALEGYVDRVGWTDLPLIQPKQVECSGVRGLIQALQGTVIHLVQSEDDESETSDMEASDSSLPQDRSELDPLNLTRGGPEREEGECSSHSSSLEAMDQDDVLGHDTSLDGGSASDTGMPSRKVADSQSEDMAIIAQPSEPESYSGRPMESQDARHNRGNPDPMWGEGENKTAKHRQLYPKVRPYTVPAPQRVDNGWYQGEDVMDPSEMASPACRVGRPNVDGSLGGDQGNALPPNRPTRQYSYYDRELHRRVTYDQAEKNEKGKYPHITEEKRITRAAHQDTALQSDGHWKEQLARNHYFPTPEDSPVNFSYRVGSAIYTVPYHVVGPMTWEYPYHSGQAQEDLSDHLVPASLYELKVTRPGYCSADAKPATTAEAQAVFDSGIGYVDHVCDTDVNAHAIPVGCAGQGHHWAALFVCIQPECTVAGGHEPLFATLEQWAAHWNTFHVAAAPAFNCMVRGCSFETTTAPDALDTLFHHFRDAHPSVYDGSSWPNLVDLVTRGLKVRPNAQYWPPTNLVGELQHPVAVTKPTYLQLESPIVAARWAVRESFHKAVVTRRRSYKKAKRRESKSGERNSSVPKGVPNAPSETDTQTPSESADEWNKFRCAADEAAAAASSKAKSPGLKKGKGSKGSAGPKDSKSSASAVAKTGSAKGSKRKGKEAGLAEKLRWDTSYKVPKRSLPDTSVSSEGLMPRKTGKFKRPAKKVAKKSSTPKRSADA